MSGTDGNHEYPDDRPLSPEPVPSYVHESEHASIPESPPEPELAMSRESTQAGPEKRRGFRLKAPSMAFLKPSYWLGSERHEVLPEPTHHAASAVTAEPTMKIRKASAPRFPFLGLKRSTRVGIVLVVSFVCLVAGLVSNKAKTVQLALQNPADPAPKDKDKPKEDPTGTKPSAPVTDPEPLLPRADKGTADPDRTPTPATTPPVVDDKAKLPTPDQPPVTTSPPAAPAGSDPPIVLEPPTTPSLPPIGSAPPKDEPKPADLPSPGGSLDFPSLPSATIPPATAEKPAPVVTPPPAVVEKPDPVVTPPAAASPVEVAPAPAPAPAVVATQPATPPAAEVAVPVRSPMPLTLEPSPPSNPPVVPTPDPMPAAVGAAALTGSGWVQIPSGGKQRVPGGAADRAPVEATPPAVVADGPRANEDSAAIDPIESVLYKVKSGENFFTISRLFYRSGRYYKALHAANARQFPVITDLYVGATIRIPPVEALDRSLVVAPSLVTPAAGVDAPASAVSRTSTRRTEPVDELEQPSNPRNRAPRAEVDTGDQDRPIRPSYTVKPNQTLRSIARDTLGDVDRDVEIRALNRTVLGDARNPTAGMVLTLPSDAVIGRRAR